MAVIFTIFLHCQPLEKHWQVYPDPGRKSPTLHETTRLTKLDFAVNCSADYVNYIVIAVTNVLFVFSFFQNPLATH